MRSHRITHRHWNAATCFAAVTALAFATHQPAAADTSLGEPELVVLETTFGPGQWIPFLPHFQLDISLRPTAEQTRQFFIDSGLDAMMSNGQMISEVATDAPAGWDPPYYNPLSFHSGNFDGNFTFGPAAQPLDIDSEALTAAVMANAEDIPVIRMELLKRKDGELTIVASGEKEHFEFEASDGGVAGVSFMLQWKGIGFNATEWFESDAEYAMRISVGGVETPVGDLNGDGVVDVADLLILLAAWGPCQEANDCPADLNGSGEVDVADMLILLANWG